MRTKGSDFSTDFGKLNTAGEELPLARLQRDSFEVDSSKKKATYFVVDNGVERESNLDDYEYWATEFGRDFLDKRGEIIDKETALSDIEHVTAVYNPQGILIARNDTYDIVKGSKEKKATIFDGYAYRVTIESKAKDTNQTYSAVLGMLSAADIRYREVKRYTVEPDRVMLDILINEEDVPVIKELDKEAKDYDVTFTFNDNISEGIQPKTIITPEKEIEEKVTASKKADLAGGMVTFVDNALEQGFSADEVAKELSTEYSIPEEEAIDVVQQHAEASKKTVADEDEEYFGMSREEYEEGDGKPMPDKQQRLAESYINGNISYVREQIGDNMSLFIEVQEIVKESGIEGEPELFNRRMVASKKTTF